MTARLSRTARAWALALLVAGGTLLVVLAWTALSGRRSKEPQAIESQPATEEPATAPVAELLRPEPASSRPAQAAAEPKPAVVVAQPEREAPASTAPPSPAVLEMQAKLSKGLRAAIGMLGRVVDGGPGGARQTAGADAGRRRD